MKQPRNPRSPAVGFTLVELLTVIAIIAILAGLVLSTAGYIQKKAAHSRAESEIAAMEAAVESYKADNGAYVSSNATDALDAKLSVNPSGYKSASLDLYKALSGDTDANRQVAATEGKIYFEFKPAMLEPSGGNGTVTAIIDPFGNSYGYSTAYAAAISSNSSAVPTVGYNPTFDLWSTSGQTTANGTVQWSKNW